MIPIPARRVALELQGFDAAYLERLRSGHPETEQNFFAYFGRLIHIKLRCRLRSPALIEDVRQETFLRVLRIVRSPEGIRHPERLGAFVNSVCNNVMLEHLNSERRHHPRAEEADDQAGTSAPDAEARLISEECKEQVRQVIAQLPERDQRLLQALLEEREKEEICEEFGVDRAYLRVLLHRAKNQFRAAYLQRQRPQPHLTSIGGGRRSSWRSAEW